MSAPQFKTKDTVVYRAILLRSEKKRHLEHFAQNSAQKFAWNIPWKYNIDDNTLAILQCYHSYRTTT